MTDPLSSKDQSKIEQDLRKFYSPCSIDPEVSARIEKKLIDQHKQRMLTSRWRFTALRNHAASLGRVLFFAILLVTVVLVIDTLPRGLSVHPAGQVTEATPTGSLTPSLQANATALPAVLPSGGIPTPSGSKNRLSLSPDGRWQAVFNSQSGGLEVDRIGGATHVLLPKETTVYNLSWSPDSSMLAVSLSQPVSSSPQTRVAEIWLSQVNGDTVGELKPFYTPGNSSKEELAAGIQIILGAWSPDSTHLLFWQGMMSASAVADGLPLWVIDTKTGQANQIAKAALVNPGYQSWAPDSSALVFSNGGYRSAQVLKWLSLYRVASGQTTYLIPQTQLVPGSVAWSPDGKQIAFAAVDAAKTGMEQADYMGWDNPAIRARRIYLLDPNTGNYRRLDQTEAYQDAPKWNGKDLLFVQMDQNQVYLMDAEFDTGLIGALPGCKADLPATAGYYGQTDWKSLYDFCAGIGQIIDPNTIPSNEIHYTLPSGLRIDEYALIGSPELEPLTFTTVRGKNPPDISFLPSTPLNIHGNETFSPEGYQTSSIIVGKDTISVTAITSTSSTASNGDVFQKVAVQIARNGQVIQTIQAGDVSPLSTLHGLWVVDGSHWVLEIAHVTNVQWADNTISSNAVGQIYEDGVLLNESNNYQEAFGFQTLNGRPFYFFQRDGQINMVYDGKETPLGYTEIPHYGCCSGAALNPKSYVDGTVLFAQRNGRWYYVGIGNTAPAQMATQPVPTSASNPVKPVVIEAIRKFSGQKLIKIEYTGNQPVDPSLPGLEREMYSVDGAEYGLDSQTNQVVWYMAAENQTAGSQTFTTDELQQMALTFIKNHAPAIQIQDLFFELGNKGENYFFRWSKAATGPGYLSCVQVGYHSDGTIFQYINTLPTSNP